VSGQRLAAVDVQRLAGEEGAGQGEQDVLSRSPRAAMEASSVRSTVSVLIPGSPA
jgi:hypothetical protein